MPLTQDQIESATTLTTRMRELFNRITFDDDFLGRLHSGIRIEMCGGEFYLGSTKNIRIFQWKGDRGSFGLSVNPDARNDVFFLGVGIFLASPLRVLTFYMGK